MSECAPLNAIEKMTAEYPNAWENADFLYAHRNELPEWDTRLCYINISGAIAALSNAGEPTNQDYGKAALCAALATWRRNKTVYLYDYDIASELIEGAEDIKIPMEILYYMPAPCVYVQLPFAGDKKVDIDGFLAFVEDDTQKCRKELRILYLKKNGELAIQHIVHLIPGATIYDGIKEVKNTISENALRFWDKEFIANTSKLIAEIDNAKMHICQAVQLLLYICSENADIIEDENQIKIFRRTDKIIDKYREIRKYNVGAKISKILRKQAEPSHKGKKPHMRRNHWHHYWVGPQGSQHLILRWILPVPVNMPYEGCVPNNHKPLDKD